MNGSSRNRARVNTATADFVFIHRALLVGMFALGVSAARAQVGPFNATSPADRRQAAETLRRDAESRRARAEAEARAKGWALRGGGPDRAFELIDVTADGRPVYIGTDNVNAAISTAANLIRNIAPYSVNGSGQRVGVWDAGAALTTHVEFGGRVTVRDGFVTVHNHATHVAGTIGASGVNSAALGMAPLIKIDSYQWGADTSEMLLAGAVFAGQANAIYLSNHSYGSSSGWEFDSFSGNSGWHYLAGGSLEDSNFGRYDSEASVWDSICYSNPYYLPVKSAGNDRGDGPSTGATAYIFSGGSWTQITYDPLIHPGRDGGASGYDCVPTYGNAKNILTIGAANDAVSAGVRNLGVGTISSFSSWGPADDGRIKPDVVANGVGLLSTEGDNNTDYASYSGTSMSSPNTTGSAALLHEFYGRYFPGSAMRAATTKALIIHTADDMGRPGPDYVYGWGYVNAKAAADQIDRHALYPDSLYMREDSISTGQQDSFPVLSNGVTPLRVTICWTDPAAGGIGSLNNPSPRLINDLDLRVLGPGGTPVYTPYVLDRLNPSVNATTGDNTLDNVEQVYLVAPGAAGYYTVQVGHKGSLTNGAQNYSLIISGQSPDPLQVSPSAGLVSAGDQGGPFSPDSKIYTLTNTSATTLTWTASTAAPWLDATPGGGALGAGASTMVTLALNPGADALPGGIHESEMLIVDEMTTFTHRRSARLSVTGCVSLPFYENFETGSLGPHWVVSGTNDHRTQVTAQYAPNAGQWHLVMDDAVSDSISSRNEMSLCADLTGLSNVWLSFYVKEFEDEGHSTSGFAFTGGANFDGIAISQNGTTWYEIQRLNTLSPNWTKYMVNLDQAAASKGLTYNSSFHIRFNHYDDQPVDAAFPDGVAFDEIRLEILTPTPTPPPSPSNSPTASPSPTPNTVVDWNVYE